MTEFRDHVLIDGDEILYKAGFAAQKTYYTLHRGKGTKPLIDFMFPGKAWAEGYIPDLPDMHTEPHVQMKPNHSYQDYVRRTIKDILTMAKKTKCVILFSEGTNYRMNVAKITPYKGSRDDSRKPILMPEIKKFVAQNYVTHIVKDIEVDDALGLFQDETTVISTQDKDLNGVPGWRVGGHGPFQHDKGLRLITEDEAMHFFYCQLISGDSTDCIPGINGYGLVKAEKLYLKRLGNPPHKEFDMYRVALSLYQDAVHDPKKLGKKLDCTRSAGSQIQEIGTLLWMQRKGRVMWTPPRSNM